MVNCTTCNNAVLVTQKRVKCSNTNCSHVYHQECVKSSYDSPTTRSKWICPACVTPPLLQSASPVAVSCSLDDVRAMFKDEFLSMRTHFESSFKQLFRDELNQLKTELQGLKESISFIDAKYDEFVKRLDNVETKVKSLNTSKAVFKDIKTSISNLECSLDSKDQWARRSNIEMLGIPEKKGENLLEVFSEVTKLAGAPVDIKSDIDFITRVAPMKNDNKQSKAIVVRFLARYKKDDCLTRLKKLKNLKACDIGFAGNNSALYFNEHLTSRNKSLLREVKKLANDHHYKYVWIKNCSILVRRDDTSQVLNISSHEDLKKIK